jgi:thiosulfate dehydrogenase
MAWMLNARAVVLLLLCAVSGLVSADPHEMPHPGDYVLAHDIRLSTGRIVPAGTRWYVPPDVMRLQKELANNSYKGEIARARQIMFGYELIHRTWSAVGEGRTDGRPPAATGHVTNCSNCHTGGGTIPNAWPFFRTLTYYGLSEQGEKGVYFGGLGYSRDARERARDCARECGGTLIIDEDSPEMDALVAWLVAIRDGIYEGEGILIPEFKTPADVDKIPGGTTPMIPGVLDMKSDPVAGKKLYQAKCASCHGADGTGLWGGEDGFVFPPLSGEGSFTHAGGPLMIPIGASFLLRNMPLAKENTLSPQEALDVMGYVATLPRPSVWWQEYYFRHAPCDRPAWLPLHVGAVPEGLPFTAEQVQFGPWRPVAEWLASAECKAKNPPSAPVLDRDFDARQKR